MNKMLGMQPDAFTRFHMMRTLLESFLTDDSKTYTILDVGGSSIYMTRFLAESRYKFKLTVIDPLPRPESLPASIEYIQASGEDIPSIGRSFDFCIMIDMLEHLPTDALKNSIVSKAREVATRAMIVAGPFDSQATDEYEHKLNDLNKQFFGVDQNWLAEHFEYGKPNIDTVSKLCGKGGWNITTFATLPHDFWLVSSITNLVPGVSEFSNKTQLSKTNQAFNKEFSESIGDFIVPEGYREFVVASPKKPKIAIRGTKNIYDKFEESFTSILTHTIKNSQKAYSDLQSRLHEMELAVIEFKNTDIQSRKLDAVMQENEALKTELRVQLEWRRKIESIPAYKQLAKIRNRIKARNQHER